MTYRVFLSENGCDISREFPSQEAAQKEWDRLHARYGELDSDVDYWIEVED